MGLIQFIQDYIRVSIIWGFFGGVMYDIGLYGRLSKVLSSLRYPTNFGGRIM